MSGPRLLRTRTPVSSKDGVLRVINRLPFAPQRLFWVRAAACARRGGHAHRTNWQLLTVVSGGVDVWCVWWAGGRWRTKTVNLDPTAALVVPPLVWLELGFMHDSVCVVLASEPYRAAEYITTREELRRLACQSRGGTSHRG